MLRKEEARVALQACGLSKNDPFIIAFRDPAKWAGALGLIAACYAVLLVVRAVVA